MCIWHTNRYRKKKKRVFSLKTHKNKPEKTIRWQKTSSSGGYLTVPQIILKKNRLLDKKGTARQNFMVKRQFFLLSLSSSMFLTYFVWEHLGNIYKILNTEQVLVTFELYIKYFVMLRIYLNKALKESYTTKQSN